MKPRDTYGDEIHPRDVLPLDDHMHECAWCHAPAIEQVPAGHAYRGRAWVRVYLWLCDQCKAEVQRAKEDSRRDD